MKETEISVKQLNNPALSAQERDELIDKIVLRALKDVAVLTHIDTDSISAVVDEDLLRQAKEVLPPEESEAFAHEVWHGKRSQDMQDVIRKKVRREVQTSPQDPDPHLRNGQTNGQTASVNGVG